MISPPGWKQEALMICSLHGVSWSDIVGLSRKAELVSIRHRIWAMVRAHRDYFGRPLSYSFIGRRMNRDHTSIQHGVKKLAREQAHETRL